MQLKAETMQQEITKPLKLSKQKAVLSATRGESENIMLYSEKILESITERELEEIRQEFTERRHVYGKSELYKNTAYGKLIMLLKLSLITMEQYTEMKEIIETGTPIRDEITNGGF